VLFNSVLFRTAASIEEREAARDLMNGRLGHLVQSQVYANDPGLFAELFCFPSKTAPYSMVSAESLDGKEMEVGSEIQTIVDCSSNGFPGSFAHPRP
jgi:hypothetical protein